jgi:hypothetical protein
VSRRHPGAMEDDVSNDDLASDSMLDAIHVELQRTNGFLHLISRQLARTFEGARLEYEEFQKDLPRA